MSVDGRERSRSPLPGADAAPASKAATTQYIPSQMQTLWQAKQMPMHMQMEYKPPQYPLQSQFQPQQMSMPLQTQFQPQQMPTPASSQFLPNQMPMQLQSQFQPQQSQPQMQPHYQPQAQMCLQAQPTQQFGSPLTQPGAQLGFPQAQPMAQLGVPQTQPMAQFNLPQGQPMAQLGLAQPQPMAQLGLTQAQPIAQMSVLQPMAQLGLPPAQQSAQLGPLQGQPACQQLVQTSQEQVNMGQLQQSTAVAAGSTMEQQLAAFQQQQLQYQVYQQQMLYQQLLYQQQLQQLQMAMSPLAAFAASTPSVPRAAPVERPNPLAGLPADAEVPGVTDQRFESRIAMIEKERNFGFLKCPVELNEKVGGKDIFILRTDVATFQVGDVVSFMVKLHKDGKPRAADLRLVRSAAEAAQAGFSMTMIQGSMPSLAASNMQAFQAAMLAAASANASSIGPAAPQKAAIASPEPPLGLPTASADGGLIDAAATKVATSE